MPTSATPRGKTANLLFGDQADFSTPAPVDYISTPFYSENLGESEPLDTDPLLGTARTNNRDQTAPAPGLVTMGGDIVVPMDVNHLPYWLTMLFGAPVTTGAGPYEHVFTSGGEVLPYRTIEIEKRAGSAFFQNIGMLASGFSFDSARAGGFRQATVNLVGRSQTKLGASAGGNPSAQLALSQIPASKGLMRIDSVDAAHFLGGSFNYQNNPAPDESLNATEYLSGYQLDDDATCSGSNRVRYVNDSYYDIMTAGDPVALELEFLLSANAKILFAMPAVTFERTPFAPISGPGGLEAEFNWQAHQTAASAMLTVTVTNQIATY
ncbi:phage tail tube protein [Roseibium sediminicola]|uniref:Phage tail tube protein n=1 Tax=Roseibium sediminicola TaxID=2933272 RepID=A0ABT0GRQ9_9HYPH|nr:phage tail tube protein [Roseibium sp. CAU 1639]MCK7611966.1 phage tail tube protein [Roseibium sp. CAU 1639]